MTMRIERVLGGSRTRLRLSGELRFSQLDEVKAEIARSDSPVALDLDELGHVDIDAVRFLTACESQGVELMNCSPFIREWMTLERATKKNSAEETGSGTAKRDGQRRRRRE